MNKKEGQLESRNIQIVYEESVTYNCLYMDKESDMRKCKRSNSKYTSNEKEK
jgi:hypothetical protein